MKHCHCKAFHFRSFTAFRSQPIQCVKFTVVEEVYLWNGKRRLSGYFPIDSFPTQESIRLLFTTQCFASYSFAAVHINIHYYNFTNPRAHCEWFVTVTEKLQW